MAIRVDEVRTQWWDRFADSTHRSVSELVDLVQLASTTPQHYPHIRWRINYDRPEVVVAGTGLEIWEIAWLARGYGDPAEVARQHLVEIELVEEALAYADAHPEEVEVEIRRRTDVTLEDLQALFPGIYVMQSGGVREHIVE